MLNSRPTHNGALAGLYIGGHWQSGGDSLRVINPATEELLASVAGGDAKAVEQAGRAASDAFPAWGRSAGVERGACLRRIAAGVEGRRERLIQLQSRNRSEEHTSELQSQSNLVCRLFF